MARNLKHKPIPSCSVAGCRSKEPHLSNSQVQALITLIRKPSAMCDLVMENLAQLGASVCNDLANRNAIGFITRQRQIQELYIRTLYLLLIAESDEQAHMLSGSMPNGLMPYYRKLRELIFIGQIDWEASIPGLDGDSFTIMETLHDGAHVSFRSLWIARGFFSYPELVMTAEKFPDHIKGMLTKLKYVKSMLNAGKAKADILDGLRAMHSPASYWAEQQVSSEENKSESK